MIDGSTHRLDHILLSVSTIQHSRARLSAMGFSVAPDARHPFGTENACVFFSDGSYLEPLGVGDELLAERAARRGNVFTGRVLAYRFRNGSEGMPAVALSSADAEGDARRFGESGFSAGEMLQFSRPMKLPDGNEVTASFKLAFSADMRSPDFFAFTCQRINVPKLDQSALITHENGVAGVGEMILSEPDPGIWEEYLTCAAGTSANLVGKQELHFLLGRTKLRVLTPERFQSEFGQETAKRERGLKGSAVVFRTDSVRKVTACLDSKNIVHVIRGGRVIVPHAEGQGAIFAFEEQSA